jgi:hypothetical protein
MLAEIAAEPYEPRGILNSEMALIIYAAIAAGVEVFIESGRARGQSTYMLAKYLPEMEIHSVELRVTPDEGIAVNRLRPFSNVHLYYGDGALIVRELVMKYAHRPMAILCDGPKGEKAVTIIEQCFKNPNVRLGFIHDMRRLDHGEPSPHRACAIERLPVHKFSDDPKLVAGTSWMDAGIAKAGGPCGPQWEAVHGSYGPTIGVFFNTQADRRAA